MNLRMTGVSRAAVRFKNKSMSPYAVFAFTSFIFLVAGCATKSALGPREFVRLSPNSTKILFGSCNDQKLDQRFWKSLTNERADLMILMGDNVYGQGNDQESLRKAYQSLGLNKHFQHFRESTPIVATWDDHDFGRSDGGEDFPEKEDSKIQFLNFWQEPKNSKRRAREGIYDSFVVGPAGSALQVILLDTRYFRSPLKRAAARKAGRGPYVPNFDRQASLLGAEQWTWLEEQLKVPADVRLIVSSIQVLSSEHGFESWGNFPLERRKLVSLLDRYPTKATIFLSGDRHHASLWERKRASRPTLQEITSSPLNATMPPEFQIAHSEPFQDGKQIFSANYGVLSIDWQKRFLIAQIRLADGSLTRQKRIDFDIRY